MKLSETVPGQRVEIRLYSGPVAFTVIEHRTIADRGDLVLVESDDGWERYLKAYLRCEPLE